MSHYSVAVIVPKDADIESAVDSLMAPYDEGLKVAPYKDRMSDEDVLRMWGYYAAEMLEPTAEELEQTKRDLMGADEGILLSILRGHDMIKKRGEFFPRLRFEGDTLLMQGRHDEFAIPQKEFEQALEWASLERWRYVTSTADRPEIESRLEAAGRTLTNEDLVPLMKDWHGREGGIDEEGMFYWSTYNPDSKWDYFVIGGRWDGVAGDGVNIVPVERALALFEQSLSAKEKYQAALNKWKGDVRQHLVEQAIAKGEEPPNDEEMEAAFKGLRWQAEMTGDVGDPTLPKLEFDSETDGDPQYGFFGYVTAEEGWVERGEMGWFGIVSGEMSDEQWYEAQHSLLKKYAGTHQLVVVDCHI